jgi:hypothetical protein
MLGMRTAQCSGGGPPITVTVPGHDTCAGNLAQTTFTWALCSCSDVQLSSELMTDGFDSTQGPYMAGGLGAGVGLNGSFDSSSMIDVGGTLWCSANRGVTTSAPTDVRQEMHSGGVLTGQLAIGTDAYVKGAVQGSPITIGGTLFHPGGQTGISGNVTYHALVDRPVDVPPPCALCPNEPAGVIPVAAIVAARRDNNDNASIGLDPGLLTGGNAPQRIDLPCGNYYLDAITNSSELTIMAHGNTALYVGGNIASSSALALTLDPTAQFDIFVGGTIDSSSELLIGSPNYPALTRTYVAGMGTLDFSSNVSLSGNLYDAAALVTWSSPVEAYGSVYAGNFQSSSNTRIHYDRAVVNVGQSCPSSSDAGTALDSGSGSADAGTTSMDGSAGGCTSCRDCNNQACIGGACGACTTSAECCPPLSCIAGMCRLNL